MRARETHPWLRVAAGALAGAAGGSAFGLIMGIVPAFHAAFFGGTGMMSLLGAFLFPDVPPELDLVYAWGLHVFVSVAAGIAFGLAVRPGRARRVVPLGMAWGFLLWLVASFLLLRLATGTPLALDVPALLGLLGHLAYGATLGAVYSTFYRGEVEVKEGTGGFRPVRPVEPQ